MLSKALQKWRTEPGFSFKCGLEIHTQLQTRQKLFSASKNNPLAPPNTNASYFDVALPGTFPTLNPEALLLALKAATVLKCNVNAVSAFDRKHYFYLDQPLGYQITQHFRPLAQGGHLDLHSEFDEVMAPKRIRIEQIQLEQDTAKLNYNEYDAQVSVDYNRACVPLIELVTKPDFDHLLQVRAFVKKYITIMSHFGICSGDLENGALRCDVNVSVQGGNRVEIKNLGSTSEITAAAMHEYTRQVDILKSSPEAKIPQETRSWNGTETVRTRSKEDAVDYRYFPDMELARIHVDPKITHEIAHTLAELPDEIMRKLMSEPYLLEKKHARFLVDSKPYLEYYQRLHELHGVQKGAVPKFANNWFFHELIGTFKKFDLPVDLHVIPPEKLADLLHLILKNAISNTSAKLILSSMIQSPDLRRLTVPQLVEHFDLASVDASEADLSVAVEEICHEVIAENADVVQKVRQGKHKSIKFLVGQAMKITQGKVEATQFQETFKRLLL